MRWVARSDPWPPQGVALPSIWCPVIFIIPARRKIPTRDDTTHPRIAITQYQCPAGNDPRLVARCELWQCCYVISCLHLYLQEDRHTRLSLLLKHVLNVDLKTSIWLRRIRIKWKSCFWKGLCLTQLFYDRKYEENPRVICMMLLVWGCEGLTVAVEMAECAARVFEELPQPVPVSQVRIPNISPHTTLVPSSVGVTPSYSEHVNTPAPPCVLTSQWNFRFRKASLVSRENKKQLKWSFHQPAVYILVSNLEI